MNANSALTSLFIGVAKVSRAPIRIPARYVRYNEIPPSRIFPSRSAFNARVSLTFDISFTAHFFYGMRLASVAVFRGQGSYLYASRLYVSPVTMPIYLAPSLPLSCKISYSSLMQISRGGLCPVKPERRNLELYDPPTLPSFFFSRKHLETSRVP